MSATGYILSCLIQLRVPVMKLPAKSPESELIKCQVSDYDGGGQSVHSEQISVFKANPEYKTHQHIPHWQAWVTQTHPRRPYEWSRYCVTLVLCLCFVWMYEASSWNGSEKRKERDGERSTAGTRQPTSVEQQSGFPDRVDLSLPRL